MKRIACIVGAVEQPEYRFPENAFVIAADRGYEYLKKHGIYPDLAIGDFDSLGFAPTDVPVIRMPVEKDDTDSMLAAKEALARGYKVFLLYGCAGGDRLSHTIANIQTLHYLASHGAVGFLLDNGTVVTVIRNSKLMFDARESGEISVFCLGADAEGVDISGLKYPLLNGTLTADTPLGAGNSFTGKTSFISVKNGTLCIIWHKDLSDFLYDLTH